jgi:paired amphipathic helix protein Sin3a
MDESTKRERLTTNDALSYLREVKSRFANNRKVYDNFLDIMKQFKAQTIDTAGVIKKVKNLFYGHSELILGFNTFLPKGFEIKVEDLPSWPPPTQKSPVEFDQAITYVNRIKQTFSNDERVYKAFLEILNQYRKGQKTIQSVYEEVALLFRNHADLLNEFSYFLPDAAPAQQRRQTSAPRRAGGAYGAAAGKPKRAPPPLRKDDPKVQREFAFLHKVKNRIKNDESYNDFLKCLNMYADDVVTREELVVLQEDIIGKHHDLMAALNEFLMRSELGPDDPYSRPYQARDRSRHANLTQKYISMPISELEVNGWERVTTSYVQLPSAYPKLRTTGRDPEMAPLMNNDWVSVTSGSEDYNFKHYRKNQYEDFLFMAEDDHFELDMIMDQNSSAIKAMKPLVERISELPEDAKVNWQLPEGALRAFHYRAVHRVYGEGAQQMLALLRQNPAVALPTILPRLEQKAEEWAETKKEMMAHWQTIFKENYKKSLDHRSFYFKQSEKKTLTPKLLFTELKDISDKKKNEKVSVLLSLAGRVDFASRVTPHISCDISDGQVALDTSRIVQCAIDNMLTADASKRVRHFYHTFFEPFFELECTCTEAEQRRLANGANLDPTPAGTTPRAARALGAKDGGVEMSTDADATRAEATGEEDEMDTADKDQASPVEGTDVEESEDVKNDDIATDVENSEEDEAAEAEFAGCRPIAPLSSAGAVKQEAGNETHCRIFYGNESLFVLLRLFQILFDRMKSARQCAAAQCGDKKDSEEAKAMHAEFMKMADSLIEGTMDPSTYEDDCRALLGTNSYQLFTLDKLVQKLVRQALTCLTEDQTHRLIDLWKYENSRSVNVVDSVYYANARVVIGDEPTVRFECTQGDTRELTFQYVEGEKSEVPQVVDARFRAYIDEYVAADEKGRIAGSCVAHDYAEMEEGPEIVRVCLKRNLQQVGIVDDVDADTMVSDRIRTSFISRNGLECKLGTTPARKTRKIAYVLGTEDFLLRKKSKHSRSSDLDAAKSEKFNSWIDNQSFIIHTDPEEENIEDTPGEQANNGARTGVLEPIRDDDETPPGIPQQDGANISPEDEEPLLTN